MIIELPVDGYFEPTKEVWEPGEDIVVRLMLINGDTSPIHFLVPHELSGQVRYNVVEGAAFHLRDLATLPENGFVPQAEVMPGDRFVKEYSMADRLTLKKAGAYTIACEIILQLWLGDSRRLIPHVIGNNITVELR